MILYLRWSCWEFISFFLIWDTKKQQSWLHNNKAYVAKGNKMGWFDKTYIIMWFWVHKIINIHSILLRQQK